MNDIAYLSHEGRYTIFEMPTLRLRIIAPKPLEKYTDVIRWKDGNLTVMAKYSVYDEPIEEYIDIQEAIHEMGLNADKYLDPIERVSIRDEGSIGEVLSSGEIDMDLTSEELENGLIRVADRNHPEEVCVLSREGIVVESSMNDQKIRLSQKSFQRQEDAL